MMNQNDRWEAPLKAEVKSAYSLPTVAELQTKRTETLGSILTEIGNNIRTAEARGNRTYSWYPKPNAPIDNVIGELRKHGYTANLKTDYDPRDGDTKYVKIDWS
jgi:hypothetical protein